MYWWGPFNEDGKSADGESDGDDTEDFGKLLEEATEVWRERSEDGFKEGNFGRMEIATKISGSKKR